MKAPALRTRMMRIAARIRKVVITDGFTVSVCRFEAKVWVP